MVPLIRVLGELHDHVARGGMDGFVAADHQQHQIGEKVADRQRLSVDLGVRCIDFERELPRHPTGKLLKRLLRDRYWGKANPTVI